MALVFYLLQNVSKYLKQKFKQFVLLCIVFFFLSCLAILFVLPLTDLARVGTSIGEVLVYAIPC